MKRVLFIAAVLCFVSFTAYPRAAEIKFISGFSVILLSGDDVSDEKSDDIYIAAPPPPLETFELPPFSFKTADEKPRTVKMAIALGYEKNDKLAAELKNRKDEIIYVINVLAREKKYEDFYSVEGKIAFAEDIKEMINPRLASGSVKEIYFLEFDMN